MSWRRGWPGPATTRIIFKHLLPATLGQIIVVATLSLPAMILAETSLSFLGLGLRPPITSWGVLLQEVAESPVARPVSLGFFARPS